MAGFSSRKADMMLRIHNDKVDIFRNVIQSATDDELDELDSFYTSGHICPDANRYDKRSSLYWSGIDARRAMIRDEKEKRNG